MARPLVMGILNVTPDSFSDGGLYYDRRAAVARGFQLAEEGADIVDVGGESTRPGSRFVSESDELGRVLSVIEALAVKANLTLSIDTTKPAVAERAVAAGARMINDVSMLRGGDDLARIAAQTGAELVLMHSRKTPQDMQCDVHYQDVAVEVREELRTAAEKARNAGVAQDKIWLDPGIGFAKNAEHNISLLARLGELVALGYKVLVGPSRKSFIGSLTGATVGDRLGGTAAAVTASILAGASAVRVHDVKTMRQTVDIAFAIGAAEARR